MTDSAHDTELPPTSRFLTDERPDWARHAVVMVFPDNPAAIEEAIVVWCSTRNDVDGMLPVFEEIAKDFTRNAQVHFLRKVRKYRYWLEDTVNAGPTLLHLPVAKRDRAPKAPQPTVNPKYWMAVERPEGFMLLAAKSKRKLRRRVGWYVCDLLPDTKGQERKKLAALLVAKKYKKAFDMAADLNYMVGVL